MDKSEIAQIKDVTQLQSLLADALLTNAKHDEHRNELDGCKKKISEYKNELAGCKAELLRQQLEIEKLRHALNKHLIYRFGSSSEKANPNQLNLFDEGIAEAIDEIEAIKAEATSATTQSSMPKRVRRPLPKGLPREDIVHDLADEDKVCDCGHVLHKIGEDTSEQLHIIPAQVKVIRHVRPKYGCRACEEGVKSADLPPQPIPKSIATSGLLSHILVSKYVDHLPLYRQENMLQRMGADIARSTLCQWVVRCAQLLEPLIEVMKKELLQSSYIQADETTLQVLNEPGRDNHKKSYLWVYRSQGPPHGTCVIFDYQPSRSAATANEFLKGFSGSLQTDGYSGYNAQRAREDVAAYGCMAHVRRRFMDIVKTSKNKPGKAQMAISFFAKLYAIEKRAKSEQLTSIERQTLRQVEAKPVLDKLKKWLEKSFSEVPPKSTLGGAIEHALKQWDYISNYVDDGEIEIDNNLVEREIRPFAVGRRNWLFSGSPAGAKASCVIYSLIQTCRANVVEPYAYLRTVLDAVLTCESEDDYRQLLPQHITYEQMAKAYR